MALPKHFCWTRFGTEAGQGIDYILARKEQERIANQGVFFWGIGNAVGAAVQELLRRSRNPEVFFSPIKSRPRAQDAKPTAVAAWILGETLEGLPFRLPSGAIVTSRYDVIAPRSTHYALVCRSSSPLTTSQSEDTIDFGELRNLLSGRPMGASQVTAVVERGGRRASRGASYEVVIRAELVYPYFVRLKRPVYLPRATDTPGAEHEWETSISRFIDQEISRGAFQDITSEQDCLWTHQLRA